MIWAAKAAEAGDTALGLVIVGAAVFAIIAWKWGATALVVAGLITGAGGMLLRNRLIERADGQPVEASLQIGSFFVALGIAFAIVLVTFNGRKA